MTPTILILAYCVLTAVASLFGGWLPSLIKLTHLRQQLMMSLVSGLMLGVALLHLLPHSVEYLPSISAVAASMLGGVLVMFFLVRLFHVHSHDSADHHHHGDDHAHSDHEHDDHEHKHRPGRKHQISWAGLFVGLVIHSLLDGVAMAASVVADSSHDQQGFSLLGVGTFLAVFLHKPLDSLAITSLMRTGNWSARSRSVVNVLFALSCPLGAIIFWAGTSQMIAGHNALLGYALAFSAGFFLCIALSDLLPEVSFHSHDRVKLTAVLLLGVAIAMGIEMTHSHDHHHDDGPEPHEHHEH
mgnify:CR=1 FL=1|tara:strand:- start:1558 stop:2454 length:897 start_codon:yes stop_codon:yes gene_type:complete